MRGTYLFLINMFLLGLISGNETAYSKDYICKNPEKALSNFDHACRVYVKFEEMSSGVTNRYTGDPCTCLCENYENVYRFSDSSDCSIERDVVSLLFSDSKARLKCIHPR